MRPKPTKKNIPKNMHHAPLEVEWVGKLDSGKVPTDLAAFAAGLASPFPVGISPNPKVFKISMNVCPKNYHSTSRKN